MLLSIVIPALNEAENLALLLPRLHSVVSDLRIREYEIIVVDGGSSDGTRDVATNLGARTTQQQEPGYGGALKAGFQASDGEYILTLDADLSHDPDSLRPMWEAIQQAEVIVASRYVPQGSSKMPLARKVLSVILNKVFTKGLSLPLHDISSGFRLYRSSAIKDMPLGSTDFDVLEEILIRCYAEGWRIREVPFRYLPRQQGASHVNLLRFGYAYLRTFHRMWGLRNSVLCADYDDRAFDSRLPPQRYWQRRRYGIITEFTAQAKAPLDIGCGSSRILSALGRVVGADIELKKLRWARKYDKPLVTASIFNLPFSNAAFDCVICSEVIEHIAAGDKPFLEMKRVLKEGGRLVLGTPDYGRLSWRIIEALYTRLIPGGYADEHITHYSKDELVRYMEQLGFIFKDVKYVLGSEMILLLVKGGAEP